MAGTMKILVAYGPRGREVVHGQVETNWTTANEPVNADGYVCCANPNCGCSKSFTGINSRKKTTRAVVVEVPQQVYDDTVKSVYTVSLAKLMSMPDIKDAAAIEVAQFRQNVFREICEKGISHLPTGTIVHISKDRDGKHYEILHGR